MKSRPPPRNVNTSKGAVAAFLGTLCAAVGYVVFYLPHMSQLSKDRAESIRKGEVRIDRAPQLGGTSSMWTNMSAHKKEKATKKNS
jgi:hypothetical protein